MMTQLSLLHNLPSTPKKRAESLELRDYQQSAIAQIYKKFRAGIMAVCLYAPTGAGKTVVAIRILADAVL